MFTQEIENEKRAEEMKQNDRKMYMQVSQTDRRTGNTLRELDPYKHAEMMGYNKINMG